MAGDLRHLQRFVTAAVRRTAPIGRGDEACAEAGAMVRTSANGMKPHERLDVYREQFWIRHLASLDEDFPTLAPLVGGRDAFRELATEYLAAHPPRTWNLQLLGASMPSFVASHPRLGRDALVVDAVRLDWAFMEVFDAPDSPPFDPRVLASTPEDAWPGAHIELHGAVRLLALAHPAHELRVALQKGAPVVRCSASPTHVVVYRDAACWLRAVALDAVAFGLLESLASGNPLGEACEAAARSSGRDSLEIGAQLGGWFQQWTASGWIRAVTFTARPA
ncbi:MAG TPA: DNA-binding domain-containing protein [Polyangiaceae bacterium]